MRTVKKRLALLGVAFGLGACALLPREDDGAESGPVAESRVQVLNKNWAEMVVYADRNGNRMRLGSVTSMGSELFTLPPTIVRSGATIRLVASPIGSTAVHVTEPIHVLPGQLVEFQVQNHLAISTVSVWSE